MDLRVIRDTEADWPNTLPSKEHFENCMSKVSITHVYACMYTHAHTHAHTHMHTHTHTQHTQHTHTQHTHIHHSWY